MTSETFTWKQTHIDHLRELLAKGFSYSQIALDITPRFGAVFSRNAIAGVVARYKLREEIPAPVRVRSPSKPRPKRLPTMVTRKAGPGPEEIVVEETVAVARQPTTLLKLPRDGCKYELGGFHARPAAFVFCAQPVAHPGSSYCKEHRALCYVPIQRKEKK